MKEYFGLQYKMINRRFKDSGIEPLFAYIILAVVFYGLSFYLFYTIEFAAYIYMLSALTLIGKLSETKRNDFLKLCFGDTKLKKIRIAENLIYLVPFLIFLLYQQLFLSSLLLIVLTVILALVNFRTTLNFTIRTPFSKRPFEFTTGFRNTFYLIIAAYTMTFISVYVDNFNLGVFAMMLVFITTLSYYTNPENEYYVWIYKLNARQFLFNKIKTAMLFSLFLTIPIVVIVAIYFYQNIGILLLFLLFGWAFLTCMIVSKYSNYPDELNITQSVFLALCIFFPPLLLVLIPYLFLKSENRLSNLLQ